MSDDRLVRKVWNYAHVLRNQGVSYGDYIEQITYLLFLKMDAELASEGELSSVPKRWSWPKLAGLDGEELACRYRSSLDPLARKSGLIGTIFRRAQNKLSDSAKLTRVARLIDS